MRDPHNYADQEANHLDREMRGQRHNYVDHSCIIDSCPDVLKVDVENEQGNREDTIAERFHSTLGHRVPL
jgi:hypothetical protein